MSENLINHIQKFVTIPNEDVNGILHFFQATEVKKKTNLQEEGKLCKAHYFVAKGCLRLFFINEKGVEQTIQFALENWWLTDYMAYHNKLPAQHFIQAVEPSAVLCITKESEEKLLAAYPYMEKYFRIIYQRATAAAQRRIRLLYELSREEMYLNFTRLYPEFVQRIPQYLLASFLGFTPEYLSEIRKKLLIQKK